MVHKIRVYKEYKGVPIFRDYNVVDEEQVYIGNGIGCHTFWFRNVREARKFIDKYRDRMVVTENGSVRGLIPRELCENCKNHYSYGTKEWKNANENNCFTFKEQLKKEALS